MSDAFDAMTGDGGDVAPYTLGATPTTGAPVIPPTGPVPASANLPAPAPQSVFEQAPIAAQLGVGALAPFYGLGATALQGVRAALPPALQNNAFFSNYSPEGIQETERNLNLLQDHSGAASLGNMLGTGAMFVGAEGAPLVRGLGVTRPLVAGALASNTVNLGKDTGQPLSAKLGDVLLNSGAGAVAGTVPAALRGAADTLFPYREAAMDAALQRLRAAGVAAAPTGMGRFMPGATRSANTTVAGIARPILNDLLDRVHEPPISNQEIADAANSPDQYGRTIPSNYVSAPLLQAANARSQKLYADAFNTVDDSGPQMIKAAPLLKKLQAYQSSITPGVKANTEQVQTFNNLVGPLMDNLNTAPKGQLPLQLLEGLRHKFSTDANAAGLYPLSSGVTEAIDSFLANKYPGSAARLTDARNFYREFSTLQDAAAANPLGVVTPNGIEAAARARASTGQNALGTQPVLDVARPYYPFTPGDLTYPSKNAAQSAADYATRAAKLVKGGVVLPMPARLAAPPVLASQVPMMNTPIYQAPSFLNSLLFNAGRGGAAALDAAPPMLPALTARAALPVVGYAGAQQVADNPLLAARRKAGQ